uniref:Uncharacterized protein n=1 Tax=Acrobeloides nanus TaxID=290746 RepID=A0A914CCT3_9BILA
MKLEGEISKNFYALFTPELNKLSELFQKYNYEMRMAGGAVRDLLMGIQPADVDFASNATPTQLKEMFEKEEIRMLHKRGEEHGTITCRINEKENFEITTLRIDVVCDGRRAEVRFTEDWKEDAFRRDLTINSLFLGLDGTVYDYTGGIKDIELHRVAFVGDPVQRIQEDYLRILRYFRFYGRIAKEPNLHESKTIEAISKNKQGLGNVSGERIWMEFKKIVVGRFAADIMDQMLKVCKLYAQLGLEENSCNLDEFRRVYEASLHHPTYSLEPMTVLSTCLADFDGVQRFHDRAKLSNAEKHLAEFIVEHRTEALKNKENIRFFQDLLMDEIFLYGFREPGSQERVILNMVELMKYIESPLQMHSEIKEWVKPEFHINGITLMNAGVKKGPTVNAIRQHLYLLWKKSGYKMSTEELLTHIDDEIPAPVKPKAPKPRKRNLT